MYKLNTEKVQGWINKGSERIEKFQRQRAEDKAAKKFANQALGEIAEMLKVSLDRGDMYQVRNNIDTCLNAIDEMLAYPFSPAKNDILKVTKGLRANAKVLEKLAKTIESTNDVQEMEETTGTTDCDPS